MRWILEDAIRNLWSALAEESLVVHLGAGCLILEAWLDSSQSSESL